jgi:hypothetical protein
MGDSLLSRGQADSSQARSAWESVPRKNRPVGYGMIGRSQSALLAWLLSCCPSGTKAIRSVEALIKVALTGFTLG